MNKTFKLSGSDSMKVKLLKKLSPFETVIQKLKQYNELEIRDLSDKEGHRAVKDALSQARKVRTGIDNDRKAIVSEIVSLQKAVNQTASTLIADVSEIEGGLKFKLDRFDAWEREAAEKIRLADLEFFTNRTDRLFSAGFTFNGATYTAGIFAITPEQIKSMEADDFDQTVEAGKVEIERIKAILAAQLNEKPPFVELSSPPQDFEKPLPERVPLPLFPPAGGLPFGDFNGAEIFSAETRPVLGNDNLADYRPPGYSLGFDACKNSILEKLNEGPIKRADLVTFLNDLKP